MRNIFLVFMFFGSSILLSQNNNTFTIDVNLQESLKTNSLIDEETEACSSENGMPFKPIYFSVKAPFNTTYESFRVINIEYDHDLKESHKILSSEMINDSIIYMGASNIGRYRILNFMLRPWWYAKNKFACAPSSVKINITLKNNFEDNKIENTSLYSDAFVNSLVVNGEHDFPQLELTNNFVDTIPLSQKIVYAIITDSTLYDSFLPLKQWKNTKGIKTEIITKEYIISHYEGESNQIKIKKCLYDMHMHKGLRYALLGGDNTIIPVLGCYANRNTTSIPDSAKILYDMPTDMYYACLGGRLDWDANHNGVYGEYRVDSVDLYPTISVTRLPVRSCTDVSSYISKLLNYEKNTNANNWNYNIFLTGGKLANIDSETGKSDAQIINDRLAASYMMNWRGAFTKLYDTYSNINNDTIHNVFNIDNFKYHISNGYAFFNIVTHGGPSSYSLSDGFFYVVNSARTLVNSSPTIVTTTACLTNAFDDPIHDPCISEAFIRNPNSNIVSYLGCSREGLGATYARGEGTSDLFNGWFYKILFSSDSEDKKFGNVVSQLKSRFSGQAANGLIRWVEYGLNPIGDAEMPIYTKPPLEFDNSYIETIDSIVRIYIGDGIQNCNVCVSSTTDFGESYIECYSVNDSLYINALPFNVTICLTKQGYVPKLFYVKPGEINIQNITISSDIEYEERKINIGRNVTSNKPEGNVVIQNGASVSVKADNTYVKSGVFVEQGATLTIKNR